MTRHPYTKTAAAMLAATLVFGQPVLAATTAAPPASSTTTATTGASQRFPDVAADHWAMKHITKLSLLGIIKGDEKGKFLPQDPVTQEQVVTMAIRMMGLEGEISSLPASNVGLEVSDYAKGYIQMALEKGLIDFSEEKTLSGLTGWGKKNATREWVAKLAIRAIGKQVEAGKLGGQEPSFKDSASISVWAKGYINEAVSLKIVTGMEDGTFKPKDNVTRAEMATFLSRAGKYTADIPSKTVTGVVESITDSAIRLVDDYGKVTSYSLSNTTAYFGVQNASILATELKSENKVYLILSGSSVVYAEVLEERAKVTDMLEGTVQEITTQESAVAIKLRTADGDVLVEMDSKLSIMDAAGKGMKLSDLDEGVQVQLKRSSARAKYSSVIIVHIPINKTAEGVIQSVDQETGRLNVLEKETGAVQYPLAETVTYINNGAAGDLATLRAGDTVRYTVKIDRVTHIEMVAPYVEPSDTGRLVEYKFDKNNTIIIIQRADNRYATYTVENQAIIDIPGMDYPTYKDLYAGDMVKVLLKADDNPIATKISVTNRTIATDYYNVIVGYETDAKVLTVKNADGQLKVYELTDATRIDSSGTTIALSNAGTVLTKGRRLDITSSSTGSKVSEIRMASDYTGVITRVDSTRSEITLKVGAQVLTLKTVSGTTIEMANKVTPYLNDLPLGSSAKVTINQTSDSITRIQLQQSILHRLTERNDTAKTLTLKSDAGMNYSLSNPSYVKIFGTNKVELSAADMELGGLYNLVYSGIVLDHVEAAAMTRGKITSVDPVNGKIKISVNGGTESTMTIGTNAKVMRDGSGSWGTLSSLNAGDRVEMTKDGSGVYVLYAAKSVQRMVDYYNESSSELNILKTTMFDTSAYKLAAKAYVHSGSQTLLPSGLKNGETVTFYTIDGKIIEIEKL
ncbi:S-layer homology domain-containing protein [Gorillibacterium sp. sgz5001074]|uniref:S-layer homology domain-containing protein n=1 Tax=Gorillibacterium sp. sgz5001074 TaxID=3446695 RepID=UPI003F67FC78